MRRVSLSRLNRPGKPRRVDYEYVRNATANVFMFVDVNRPWRCAKVTDQRTSIDFAGMHAGSGRCPLPGADRIRAGNRCRALRRMRVSESAEKARDLHPSVVGGSAVAKTMHLICLTALACSGGSVRPGDGAVQDTGAEALGSDCTSADCGPPPQLASTLACGDGTTAGPVCSRYASGACAWSLTACPGSTSCTGEACGPSFPGGLCLGLGNSGVCVTDGKNGCTWRVTCFDLPPPDASSQ